MDKRLEEHIPILGRVYINLINLTSKIYDIYEQENEITRQKETPHLGLVSQAFKGISHSRYDYLILQCVISELVENNFKGTTSAQGSIKINKKEYFGNEIIKCWILLSNFGHCKNTIGDEKSILLKIIQNKSFEKNILKSIKDEQLKVWAKEVITEFDYVNFHHIISLWRIYKVLSRKKSLLNEIILVYKILLLDNEHTKDIANSGQVEQLKLIYRNIRDLSIISLDTQNSSLPISIDILSTILSFDFYENRYQETKTNELFNPIISLLCDKLYLNPKTQTFQRSYEVSAIENMSNNLNDVISKAIITGLSNPKKNNLKHFLRIQLHQDFLEKSKFKDAVRNILTIKKGVENVEASMDYNPYSKIRILDFYIDTYKFANNSLPKFLSNIGHLLEKQFKGTLEHLLDQKSNLLVGVKNGVKESEIDEASKEKIYRSLSKELSYESWDIIESQNIPTFKEILWSVLTYHIKSEYYFDIDHHISKKHKHFGVRINNNEEQIDSLKENIDIAIDENIDIDRKHELKQLKQSISREFKGTTIVCISRIIIYDYSKSPNNRKVTDIDSLVLKFNENEMILEFHESKNTKKPFNDAKKDINEKLIRVLNPNSKGYRVREVKNYGAKIVIKHKT
ncbi:hypothetical protein QVZ41_12980 [Wenyingzhuangia sp. chi5]|uniref:Uncharacterized protein n=1 Tax=Wenyingzhuangia gilva TaxID=3057677 RepID=A0ABT8VUW5_9FLAO|nr:hypothetical protein [Wenyingzhuangia sp. chi5]MDO3695757.1 hypothetical protein [Wenyingzhuangia sp. chi5]